MALTNFSLPFGGLTSQNWAATVSPLQPHHVNAVNNLLYGPAGHQETEELPSGVGPQEYYKNNPYSPPQNHQFQYNSNTNNNRRKGGNSYLPPNSSSQSIKGRNLAGGYDTPPQQRHQQQKPLLPRVQQQFSRHNAQTNSPSTPPSSRTYDDGQYHPPPPTRAPGQFFNGYNTPTRTFTSPVISNQHQPSIGLNTKNFVPSITSTINRSGSASGPSRNDQVGGSDSPPKNSEVPTANDPYPERPPGFTRVKAGQGARTQVHAVLDYDVEEGEEDYYDDDDEGTPVSKDGKKSMPTVTPIQGPIFLKNGTVPVVPLLSYPTINNGTFVQIPIWWTALSVALGLDIQGDVIKGVPCIKRYHQLFCPTAGNSYPIDKIERFIDDNKALMRRMYGDFEMNPEFGGPLQQTKRRRRYIDDPDIFIPPGAFPAVPPDDLEKGHNSEAGETYFGNLRKKRQSETHKNSPFTRAGANDPIGNIAASTGRMDACESKIEIVTPYWASNAGGKIRAIVNTQHFEQAIHQEICTKLQTNRCTSDCGCEQKYKWHRLLAYDPDNDCKGIFMDWFLFPSCCVCRCSP